MHKKIALMIATVSCLFVGNAFCADWKLYGKYTSSDSEAVMFYDRDSINNLGNTINLWTKTVSFSEIVKILENKAVVDKATTKIANGYIAPITKLYPQIGDAPYLEEAANGPAVKSKAEILYQLVCSKNKFRKVSGTAYHQDGRPELRFGIGEWESIEAESNAGNLARIVCGSPQ